jgi:cell division GTPase FtsZ
MSIEMIEVEEFNLGTQIKVIGVGGGGGNAVQHMIERQVQGVEFICANTDAQSLSRSPAHKTIQLGVTGLGAGSKPEKGATPPNRQSTTSGPPSTAPTCCSSPPAWAGAPAPVLRR